MGLFGLLEGATKAVPDSKILAVVEIKLGVVNGVVAGGVNDPRVGGKINLVVKLAVFYFYFFLYIVPVRGSECIRRDVNYTSCFVNNCCG